VHVDGAVKRLQLAAAHGLHDLVAREHAAGALGQRHQQVELVGGELGRLARHGDGAGVAVDLQRAKAQGLCGGRAAALGAPAQHGADARQQLARLKGLGQVVVGAQLQADDAVHRVALGGEHQHRHLGRGAGQRADAAAHVQAVHVGQHQVEDDQIGRIGLHAFQSAEAVSGVRKGKSRLDQVFADHPGQAAIVFDHQQAGTHGRSVIRAGMGP
jgi:hypothetical protein